jgi:hypothetical protein
VSGVASRPTAVDGEHFEALLEDLGLALSELAEAAGAVAEQWTRSKPGKWTAGQHVDHIAASLALTAGPFEGRVLLLRSGTLPERPRRGPLQSLWIGLVIKRGRMPRGARADKRTVPAETPDRAKTMDTIGRLVGRHAAVGAALSPSERDRLWIWNPLLPRWQYTLPEIIRVHAVHARHHARLVREIERR